MVSVVHYEDNPKGSLPIWRELATEAEGLNPRLSREDRVTLADEPLHLVLGLAVSIVGVDVLVPRMMVCLKLLSDGNSVVFLAFLDWLRSVATNSEAFVQSSTCDSRPA